MMCIISAQYGYMAPFGRPLRMGERRSDADAFEVTFDKGWCAASRATVPVNRPRAPLAFTTLTPMQVTITVESVNGHAGPDDLRRWLGGQPALRGRVRRQTDGPLPGTMGAAGDVVLAVLEPGGVAAAFAGAVVAWVRTRRGTQTVTLTRPDGTRLTVSTTEVKGLDAQQAAELAQRLAATLEDGRAEVPPAAPPAS